jgi:hypothetical protein
MRIAAIGALLISLGACAEVTTFRRPDGSVYHHVNCGDSMKLESCHNAAGRTCPNGYARMDMNATGDVSPTRRADSFFVCR